MQPGAKAPRTPAHGHDTSKLGARCSPTPSGQCENRPSHQTQYRRFHEIIHAPGGLPKPGDDGELWCGLLIGLAVRDHHLAAFTPA